MKQSVFFICVSLLLAVLVSGFVNAATYTCNGCADCESKIANASAGDVVQLTADISDHVGGCIDWDTDGVVFDCQGHLIDGDGIGDTKGIWVSRASNNTIQNCAVSGFRIGILLYFSSGTALTGNTLTSNDDAIKLSTSHDNTLTGNMVHSNGSGIRLFFSQRNMVTNNIANSNLFNGIGVYAFLGADNIITNNQVTSNGHGIYLSGSSGNTITDNDLTGNDRYSLFESGGHGCNTVENNIGGSDGKLIRYEHDTSGITISDTSEYSEIVFCRVDNSVIDNVTISNPGIKSDGILFVYSNNNVVKDSNLNNTHNAVHLFYSSGNTLAGNTLASNESGIYFDYSPDNAITGNFVTSSGFAVSLISFSSGNTITGNTLNSNVAGISLVNQSLNNTISMNTVSLNEYGISLFFFSSNNIITNNIVTSNTDDGINIASFSSDNIVTDNIVGYNGAHGLHFYDSLNTGNTVSNNAFCFNNQSAGGYYDIYNNDSNANFGSENSCDTTYNWNDVAATGCTYSCVVPGAVHIDSISPGEGIVGTVVQIMGENFGPITDKGNVEFVEPGKGTKSCTILTWQDNSISCIVPEFANPGNYIVRVSTLWDTSNAKPFRIVK